MTGDISIDLGSALPYAVEKVLGIFGKGTLQTAAKKRLTERVRVSLLDSSTIQCVGMNRPIPIETLYQPTRLRSNEYKSGRHLYNLDQIIELQENSVVWGSPGAGKSVFLKSAYLKLQKLNWAIPILFTLRAKNAIEDLAQLIVDLQDEDKFKPKSKKIVLLIDGFDEIGVDDRKHLAELLKKFTALESGFFLITCRLYYDLVDIIGRYFWIEPFDRSDALAYTTALVKIFDQAIDPEALLSELDASGFSDFLESPLMLTLVCILKSGPLPQLPRNTIGLIRRAIETLTFRWDESRGIAREGEHELDGEERVRCLMRIAFKFKQPIGAESVALATTRHHMALLQRPDVNPQKFLIETARWYGMFVPAGDDKWTFTHRTVHDFLAARHWVEGGTFSTTDISEDGWNARTAYAACLSQDATSAIRNALARSPDLSLFSECVNNGALFDVILVAKAVTKRFSGTRFSDNIEYDRDSESIRVSVPVNYFHSVSDQLLFALLRESTNTQSGRGFDCVYILATYEFKRRKLPSMLDLPSRRSGLKIGLKFQGEPLLKLVDS